MRLEAQPREAGDPRALRSEGRLPAVVYNKGMNRPVSVDHRAFDKVFRETGTSHLIELELDGEVHRVVVKAVQMDKRRRVPQHVDFYAVTAGQKLQIAVALEFVGEPVGVKEGGELSVQRREVTIAVRPRDIPEHVRVDIAHLAVGDSLHVGDIVRYLPAEADVVDDLELAVIAVVPPRLVVEEEPTDADLEPELVGAGDEGDDAGGDRPRREVRDEGGEDADED